MNDTDTTRATSLGGGGAQPPSTSWSVLRGLTPARLTLGLWAIAAGLDLAISFMGGGGPATIARVTATYAAGGLLALASLRSASSGEDLRGFSFARICLVAVPSGTLLFVVDVLGRALAHGQAPWRQWPWNFFLRLRPDWAYCMMLFVFQSTVSWLASASRVAERHERRLLDARLAALRLQLDPHFLMNTLNALSTLVRQGDAACAERMIDRLAAFLETSLSVAPGALVPLSAEIDMAQAYLEIEAVRFGERLDVSYTCQSGLSDALVPSLILQPLIENALKHGVGPDVGRVRVSISAACADGRLSLVVADDGSPTPTARTRRGGVGQANVAARLRALYGDQGRLEVDGGPDGYVAAIRMPLVVPETDARM